MCKVLLPYDYHIMLIVYVLQDTKVWIFNSVFFIYHLIRQQIKKNTLVSTTIGKFIICKKVKGGNPALKWEKRREHNILCIYTVQMFGICPF